eukprot:4059073-Pyramimonas_sp.AAC.1
MHRRCEGRRLPLRAKNQSGDPEGKYSPSGECSPLIQEYSLPASLRGFEAGGLRGAAAVPPPPQADTPPPRSGRHIRSHLATFGHNWRGRPRGTAPGGPPRTRRWPAPPNIPRANQSGGARCAARRGPPD